MSDERNTLLEWGVRPLPKSERVGTRQGVGATQRPLPARPPAGGSAVPPAPAVKQGARQTATGGDDE
jgi:hypothetical protein